MTQRKKKLLCYLSVEQAHLLLLIFKCDILDFPILEIENEILFSHKITEIMNENQNKSLKI